MRIAKIFFKLGKRLRKKKEKVTDPEIKKGYSPSDGLEDVSENRISFADSSVIDNEGTEDDESNQLKLIARKKEKVTDPEVKKGYSPSDGLEDVSENGGSSSTSLGISNSTVNDGELRRLKPVFFTECEWVLSKLAKAGKPHYREKFFQILQRNYSNEFEGPLDFEKVRSKSVRARLLAKTISEYCSPELKTINSLQRYSPDSDLICKIGKDSFLKEAQQNKSVTQDLVDRIAPWLILVSQNFKYVVTFSLTKRERDILFKRYFVKEPQSLKSIGQYYALSRERIRQVETKALTRLRENGLHIAFLYELFKLGLPNILQVEQLTAINKDLGITSKNPFSLIRITSKIIKQIKGNAVVFNFYFVGTKFIYLRYYNYPDISRLSIKKWIDTTEIPKEEFKNYLINEEFCFFTEDELEILHSYFSEQHRQSRGKRRLLKDLIIKSLRLIGCPAHYSDITEKVREIDGEKYRNCSPNSIRGALSIYNDFVWVGKRGVYGLKEWGLSSPDKSLEDQIYTILKDSAKSLSKEGIAIALSKKRPYFSESSLNLILSTSDKIIKNQNNLYRVANKEDKEVRIAKKAQTDKMSNAMEEVFREWEKQKNSE